MRLRNFQMRLLTTLAVLNHDVKW